MAKNATKRSLMRLVKAGDTAGVRQLVASGVKLLIEGSDIHAVDKERRDAYDLASKWGKKEVAEFLKHWLKK